MNADWLAQCLNKMLRNLLKDLTIEVRNSPGGRCTYTFSVENRDDYRGSR